MTLSHSTPTGNVAWTHHTAPTALTGVGQKKNARFHRVLKLHRAIRVVVRGVDLGSSTSGETRRMAKECSRIFGRSDQITSGES